ncbi:hypothetical protein BDN72DRAFT_959050 [Pluteus cervinus]|uniref:Uncharacterized protein n=1 Tax=Pluteus cervinus TaxID=181527 RepID=A0ACD3AWP1_9AGAR|nr:hypothetical protein BDN72DRAFT_959050 [Pluteus cervinus]
MLQPIFPTELVFEIVLWVNVDFIDFDRCRTLFSCCLVSRSWLAIAQPLLFSRVILKVGMARREDLATTIINYPKVKQYIHQLQLDIRPFGSGNPVQDVVVLAGTLGGWKFRGLRLENALGGFISQSFLTLPPSDRLTSLSLRAINVVPSLLTSLPSTLRELQLRDVYVENLQSLISGSYTSNLGHWTPSPRPRIQKLSITNGHRIVSWFCQPHCHLDLSQLETLLLCEDGFIGNLEIVRLFLCMVGPTIQHLFLDLPSNVSGSLMIPSGSRLPLEDMKQIKSISLRLSTHNTGFLRIVDFLKHLPGGQLEEFCIYTVPMVKKLAHAPGWGILDDELTVKGTHVYICPPASTRVYTRGEKDKVLLATIFRLAPTLYNQGRLTVIPSFGPSMPVKDDLKAPLSSLGPTYIPVNSSGAKMRRALWRFALSN